jgi:hypothetical protein
MTEKNKNKHLQVVRKVCTGDAVFLQQVNFN